MSSFLNEKYRKLEAYVPGEQPQDKKYIKLNTNESPYPPSPEVIEAVNANEVSDLRLYSDPDCRELISELARFYRVGENNIFVSNGSDDILNFAFMAFCDSGAVFPDITYGFYKVFADLHNVSYKQIPLNLDFTVNTDNYVGIGKTVFIANPNAPTGIALSPDEIEKIVSSNQGTVIVIDEAYVDFGAQSCLPLLDKYNNLLIVRTYSKSRSLAGARLGYAIASEELISDLNRIKFSTNPYNVNRLTLRAGVAAIESDYYFSDMCAKICATRERFVRELLSLGFRVLPSKANFVFAESDKIIGDILYRKLKERGILIRHFQSDRINNFNRITIGTDEQMRILLQNIKQLLEELT